MTPRTAITTNDARLDIRVRGFWSAAQDAYLDVRVIHPKAQSNSLEPISADYKRHEDSKKKNGQCHMANMSEMSTLVSLHLLFFFSTTWRMGKEATVFYKKWRICFP